jgi:hypothetical protein
MVDKNYHSHKQKWWIKLPTMQTLMVEKSTNDTNIMVDKINNNNNMNNFSGVSQSVNGGLNHQPMVD